MNHKLHLTTALASAFFLTACIGIEGDGRPATEARSHEGFVAVENDTSLDILITRGDTFGVALRVDANLLPHVTTRVRGGALHIDSDVAIDPDIAGPHVVVTMPSLEAAALSGSGEIVITGFESDAPIRLELAGSGDVAFTGRASAIAASLSGSGNVEIVGATGRVDLDLSGSGTLDAKDLHATDARVDLSGSGDVFANVAGPVDIDLSGSGDVELYGEPDIGRKDTSGSGEIILH